MQYGKYSAASAFVASESAVEKGRVFKRIAVGHGQIVLSFHVAASRPQTDGEDRRGDSPGLRASLWATV